MYLVNNKFFYPWQLQVVTGQVIKIEAPKPKIQKVIKLTKAEKKKLPKDAPVARRRGSRIRKQTVFYGRWNLDAQRWKNLRILKKSLRFFFSLAFAQLLSQTLAHLVLAIELIVASNVDFFPTWAHQGCSVIVLHSWCGNLVSHPCGLIVIDSYVIPVFNVLRVDVKSCAIDVCVGLLSHVAWFQSTIE